MTDMYPPVEITDVNAASNFCRWVDRNCANLPKSGWFGLQGNPEGLIRRANWFARKLGPKNTARALAETKTKRGFSLHVTCEKCGRFLSAPESVAAGIGPECQAA